MIRLVNKDGVEMYVWRDEDTEPVATKVEDIVKDKKSKEEKEPKPEMTLQGVSQNDLEHI